MKELRVQSKGRPFRIFFAFDPTRRLSTLIDYMKSIGMGIKIMGIPKNDDEDEFEILTAKAK